MTPGLQLVRRIVPSALILTCVAALFAMLHEAHAQASATPPQVDSDGTIHVPAFNLPLSSYLKDETRAALKQWREVYLPEWLGSEKLCPSLAGSEKARIPSIRKCLAVAFQNTTFYKSVRNRYSVSIKPEELSGVPTEVFVPDAGIAEANAHRVLVNVHGGGFTEGWGTISRLESIPIASIGKIKVVSINYRMAPEYTFPAASEDIVAVYQELLKTYPPQNIGLFGCSAGAALLSEAVALLQQRNLPRPGALGMFCYGAWGPGDGGSDTSNITAALFGGTPVIGPDPLLYFRGVDLTAPLVSPRDYHDVMAKFPPSLLISGTRDHALSSVLVTHAQLTKLGVDAELHVWEGMRHGFFYNPALPEAQEAYLVITRFFDSHLGRSPTLPPQNP